MEAIDQPETVIDRCETVYVFGTKLDDEKFDTDDCQVFDHNGYHWIVGEQFHANFKLPDNVYKWDQVHINSWMEWAKNEYNLSNLCTTELKKLTPNEYSWNIVLFCDNNSSNDEFRTHIRLLKTMHKVYIKKKDEEPIDIPLLLKYKYKVDANPELSRNVEIWQFLLYLLTSSKCQHVIEWVGNDGTFKIIKPNTVSWMWGLHKNNFKMTYSKMAAALRYHYGKGIIERANGKLHYKFVKDIKTMIGHSPMDIKNMFDQEPN